MPGKLFIPDLTTNQMAFPDTAPRKGDSDNNLLFKIAQELSEQNGGAFPPMLGDSDNILLRKILQLLILGGTGGGGTCTADLATCNASLATCSAALAACQAVFVPQDMQWDWTPTSIDLGELFGYGTGGTENFPGITSVTFRGDQFRAGFIFSTKADLLTASFPNLTSVGVAGVSLSFTMNSNPVLTSISAPNWTLQEGTNAPVTISANPLLTSLNLNSLQSVRGIVMLGNSVLTSINLPALTTTVNSASGINITAHPLLTTINLSALISLGASLILTTNTVLANLDLSSYVPANGRVHTITGAALTDTSVNQILARGVANAAYVSGTINTSGGTSSAPTGQGILDKATLIVRGVTVTTN